MVTIEISNKKALALLTPTILIIVIGITMMIQPVDHYGLQAWIFLGTLFNMLINAFLILNKEEN